MIECIALSFYLGGIVGWGLGVGVFHEQRTFENVVIAGVLWPLVVVVLVALAITAGVWRYA